MDGGKNDLNTMEESKDTEMGWMLKNKIIWTPLKKVKAMEPRLGPTMYDQDIIQGNLAIVKILMNETAPELLRLADQMGTLRSKSVTINELMNVDHKFTSNLKSRRQVKKNGIFQSILK